jgi:hypothetical protein
MTTVTQYSILPSDITFISEGNLLVAGAPGIPGAAPRGKALAIGPAGYVVSSNGTDVVWVPPSATSLLTIGIAGGPGLTITNSPLTASGDIGVDLTHPTLTASGGTITGTISLSAGTFTLTGGSSGSVTSVGLTTTGTDFTITDSPVTTSGDINIELAATGVVSGSYDLPTVYVDTKGRITSISPGTVNLSSQVTGNLPLSNIATIADKTILSNIVGSSAVPAANTLTFLLDTIFGSTQGNILYRDASSWAVLAPGVATQILASGGSGANPYWKSGGTTNITTVNTSTIIDATYNTVLVDATSAPVTISVATAGAGTTGRTHIIKKIDSSANPVVINVVGGGNIDGVSSASIPVQNMTLTVQSTSTDWYIL